MTPLVLPTRNLAERHIGLTPEIASYYLQAASVCLSQHHLPPTIFTLQENFATRPAIVEWEMPSERHLAAWANQNDATEAAAYVLALATVEMTKGLVAVCRAETRTGVDYYLASVGPAENLEDWIRLEVSGTQLDELEVNSRVRQKVRQVLKVQSKLPALVVVVGFRLRVIVLRQVEEEI